MSSSTVEAPGGDERGHHVRETCWQRPALQGSACDPQIPPRRHLLLVYTPSMPPRYAFMTVAMTLCLSGLSCSSTTPTEAGRVFTPKINDGPVPPSTARWLAKARGGEAQALHQKSIQIASGEATIEVQFGTLREPTSGALYLHSLQVRVADNQAWTITVRPKGTSVNRGTIERPLQGITIMVSALKETPWRSQLTQTMVNISAGGSVATN